jgi:AAA domain
MLAAKTRVAVAYTVGDASNEVEWDFEATIDALTSVDTFDSRFAQIHVDDRLEYSYTPNELAVFHVVSNAIDRIRKKLSALVDAKLSFRSNFQTGIPEGVSFRDALAKVGASTNVEHLRSLTVLSDKQKSDIERLDEKIVALQAADATAALKQTTQDVSVLCEAAAAYTSICGFDWTQLDSSLAAHGAAMQAFVEAGLGDLKAPSPGADTEEWRDFIEAGERLIQAHVGSEYPEPGSDCIYCGQELDDEAITLVRRYRAYCTGELKAAVDDALAGVQTSVQNLSASDFSATIAKLKARTEAEEGAGKIIWDEITQLLEKAETVRAKISKGESLTPEVRADFAEPSLQKIKDLEKKHEDFAQSLGGEDTKRVEELKSAKVARVEYDARGTLAALLDEIEKSVGVAAWIKTAQDAQSKFTGILRSLTGAAKAASGVLLNDGFETRFVEECSKLHAPSVKLSFPGSDGRVERKKLIFDRYALSQILSEGEQKAVALADFLAETRLRKSPSPIIFDDPVNSLDYKRIGYVACRLAELADDRQVIIFTHNIWFASEILSYFDKRQADCTYYDIEASGDAKGVLTKGNSPRTDSYKKNKSTINKLIQAADSLSGEAKQALVERGYEHLRNTCEIVVERELFQEVTRRYEPNIRMTKLDSIKYDKLQAATSKTFDIFEECCRKIASHSQPTETLNVKPTLDDLKANWEALQQVRKDYVD